MKVIVVENERQRKLRWWLEEVNRITFRAVMGYDLPAPPVKIVIKDKQMIKPKTYVQRRVEKCKAVRWFKHGDHPAVKRYGEKGNIFSFGGCGCCKAPPEAHGWIVEGGENTLTSRIGIVCPGNVIADYGDDGFYVHTYVGFNADWKELKK